ncbi:MAG: phosphoribosylamine--glycine ligase [Erysipelotrichaceae bacterium]
MKVLIIGKGGREHALAKKCAASPLVSTVYVAPGNTGMRDCATLVDIDECNVEGLLAFAKDNNIQLTIPGCEAVLACGVVDAFEAEGLQIFGPSLAAARIESSKTFAKDLMDEYGIKTAAFKSFTAYEEAYEYVLTQSLPIVIKEDGLKAGKGVYICPTLLEAKKHLQECFQQPNRVVVEQYLEGFEFSFITLVQDGVVIPLQTSQDHKRAYDGDQGPNTGGMGVYSPVEKIDATLIQKAMDEVMIPVVKAMEEVDCTYQGFLYGGLMLCQDGIYVIEFNARLGDPETQVILPAMESDLVAHILDLKAHKEVVPTWYDKTFVGVVMASTNYPASSTKGAIIVLPETLTATIYHMGTKQLGDQLVTDGGRVLLIVGEGRTIEEARAHAYENVARIECDALFYRSDIGFKALENNV